VVRVPALHIVTNERALSHRNFLQIAAELAESMPDRVAFHLRAHSAPAADIFPLAEALAARATGALLMINDRIDIAAAVGVAGVQLGARSLTISQAREILGPAAVIGYSAHRPEEAARAQQDGANFVLVGMIYKSNSHPERTPAGVDLIRQAAQICTIPIVAIGGVTAARIAELHEAGAAGVAVIGAVWDAPDPVQAARELVRLLDN
jgi:thiamine-phosphate diphosphorylase